jgi:hypothetical protein
MSGETEIKHNNRGRSGYKQFAKANFPREEYEESKCPVAA